jgi:hypothetical protein
VGEKGEGDNVADDAFENLLVTRACPDEELKRRKASDWEEEVTTSLSATEPDTSSVNEVGMVRSVVDGIGA